MMGIFQKQIEITETDNGFVLEWRDEDHPKTAFNDRAPTRGMEVYKTKEEMLARIGRFF